MRGVHKTANGWNIHLQWIFNIIVWKCLRVCVTPVKQPLNWSQTEGRQTEEGSERTKPLRIKAAPVLTPNRLWSAMRSIFKHNIRCSIFPLRSVSSRYHTAWIKTPLKSTVRAAHKQTRKHSEKHWLGLWNQRGDLLVCVCTHIQECVLKAWSKRPLLETIGLKCCCSWAPDLPLTLANPFLFLPSSLWISLPCPSSHLSCVINL